MEEAGELAGEGGVHVVDESFEVTDGAFQGDDFVVGYGGGDEGGVALGEGDFVLGLADADLAAAFEAHNDDEGIVAEEVAMDDLGALHDLDVEVGGGDDGGGAAGGVAILGDGGLVVGAVLVVDLEVDGLGGKVGMELTGAAIEARSVVVVDAIGDIAGLLNLGQTDAATDGMDTTGREVEDITRVHLMACEGLDDGAIGYPLLVLLGGDVLLETGIEVGSGLGIEDVPHLGLAELVMLALGHLIVGVDLNGEVLTGIDDLGEDGELAVVLAGDLLAEDLLWHLLDDIGEAIAGPGAIFYLTLRTRNGRDGPVLGAPDERLAVGLEEEGVELVAMGLDDTTDGHDAAVGEGTKLMGGA